MPNSGVLLLPTDLSIGVLESMCAPFKQSLDKKTEIVLNGSRVERVDTAGLQFLYAVTAHYSQQGRVVLIQGASKMLVETAGSLGLKFNWADEE